MSSVKYDVGLKPAQWHIANENAAKEANMKKIAQKTQVREVSFEGPIWVGVDVHKKSYAVAIIDKQGISKSFSMAADDTALVSKLQQFTNDIACVAYEAGPCGYSLYYALNEAGIPALVAAPSRIPRPVTRGAKTDSLDCRKIADYAARDMLVPVFVPEKQEAGIRTLQRRRHKLTDLQRKAKQHIRALLLEKHLPEPAGLDTWSKGALATLQGLRLDMNTRITLDSLLRELEFLHAERCRIDDAVADCLNEQQKRRVENLQTIPGVGPTLARTFVTEIFQPERFPHAAQLASYVGLAPVVQQSGERGARGALVRTGQRRLRSLLVECAWQHKSKDAGAEALYKRIVSRTSLPQKAITAVARRLGILLWRLSVENRPYTF